MGVRWATAEGSGVNNTDEIAAQLRLRVGDTAKVTVLDIGSLSLTELFQLLANTAVYITPPGSAAMLAVLMADVRWARAVGRRRINKRGYSSRAGTGLSGTQLSNPGPGVQAWETGVGVRGQGSFRMATAGAKGRTTSVILITSADVELRHGCMFTA